MQNRAAVKMQAGRFPKQIGTLTLVSFALIQRAQAGMTVYGLRDVYRLRFEEISFFILLLLVCTGLSTF